MSILLEFLATFCAGIFAGAATYITLVEHPARMECSTALAATEFEPSYRRAAVMQALLATFAFVASVIEWWLGAGVWWLIGAVAIVAVIPFTLIIILPTNKRLLDPSLDRNSEIARQLLTRWGRLHVVRTVLSLAAFAVFLLAMASGVQGDTPMRPSGDSLLGAREAVLRQNLFSLRWAISQYTVDKQKTPESLDDLVNAGYLKQIPIDPMTGKSDWTVDQTDVMIGHEMGISAHSSSAKIASDRRAYSTW